MGLKALIGGVFKSGKPLIFALERLTRTVKALTLGVLKSGRPHLDWFFGFIVVLVLCMCIYTSESDDNIQMLNEDERTKRLLILSGYAWITLLVSSLSFRWIRLWYFDGDAFWKFSTHHQQGSFSEELNALIDGSCGRVVLEV